MKKINIGVIIILIVTSWGCEEEALKEHDYIFLKQYCTTVIAGGVVGATEKCFEEGDVVVGHKRIEGALTIIIPEHSLMNNVLPPNARYQKYVDVPLDYLGLKD